MADLFGEEKIVSVLVPYPVDKAYSYALPVGMNAQAGDYVVVPLGGREVIGVVWDDAVDEEVSRKKLKSVVSKYESVPPMPAAHRKFIDWVAHYNMTPRGSVLKMALSAPKGLEEPKSGVGYKLLTPLLTSPLERGEGCLRDTSPPSLRGEIERGVKQHARSHPAWEQTRDYARELRKDMTEVEKKLWAYLRREQMGCRFRKQHPVPPYIVDFACPEKNLVVELDGGQHSDQSDYDGERTKFLESQGFRVLRFWNNEIDQNLEGVLETIIAALKDPPLNLPPQGGGRDLSEIIPPPFQGGRLGGGYSLSPKQQKIVDALSGGAVMSAAALAKKAGCTAGVVKTLAKNGILDEVEMVAPPPCAAPDHERHGPQLSEAQQAASDELCAYVEAGGYTAVLLDGVTGAGKTETYFEAVAKALDAGKQILILLPEIALSNAFLDRFKSRFGCPPALWHSQLTPAQRRDTWRGVARGESKVVVGARSALFLPYQDLGLIIVDEEHDPAYKQEDNVIYHARDMAIVRAHIGKLPIALVSATPALETMMNVWDGRYQQLHLPDRHGGARLPDIHVIDMREDKPERQHFIAPTLKNALAGNFKAGEQSLLFLNRRGYAPLTICRSCGHRMACPRCTAWLVEHKASGRLHCHHCDYSLPFPPQCPECGEKDSLAACGPGVERIFEEVREYFPQARVTILASDTAQSHDELRAKLEAIKNHEYDIIIGTQIIAKGHHFPNLTLVGVVDADLGMQGGDLRAAERTYQLLHQVAGRAGREQLPGHVFLQTWFPDNKVMQALASSVSPPLTPPQARGKPQVGGESGRDAFLRIEAAEREVSHMPPFSRLAGIVVSGKNEDQVIGVSNALGKCAPQGEAIQTLGPVDAPFYRLRGNFRRRLLVRADKTIDLQKALSGWLAQVKIPSTVRVYIDIDPQSFL